MLLKDLNIEPERVRLDWVSTNESAKLEAKINDFIKDLKKLGPIQSIEKQTA